MLRLKEPNKLRLDTADASKDLTCVAIYAMFKLGNGKHSCQLVFARSKIVGKETTTPRAELRVITVSFGKYHKNHLMVTNSQVILHWIHTVRAELKLRVSKNIIADMGTRKGAKIKDIEQDIEWINGKPWMSMDESDFPLKNVQDISLSQ